MNCYGAKFNKASMKAMLGMRTDYSNSDMIGVDAESVDFAGSNFMYANLSNSNFRYANFYGSNMMHCNIGNSDFRNCNLHYVYLKNAFGFETADFTGALWNSNDPMPGWQVEEGKVVGKTS